MPVRSRLHDDELIAEWAEWVERTGSGLAVGPAK
jgi:hypothetical protein